MRVCRVWYSTTGPQFYHLEVTWSASSNSKLNQLFSKAFGLPKPCKSIVSHGSGIIFIYCWQKFLKKAIFRLFCRPAIETPSFVMTFWKHSFSDNDFFRRKLKTIWQFHKTVFLSLMRRRKNFLASSFYAHPNNGIKLRNEFWSVK